MKDFEKAAGKPEPRLVDGTGLRVVVVVSRYNQKITEALFDGARLCLEGQGVAAADILRIDVPGAWEVPLGLRWAGRRHRPDALIGIGVVIRGGTPHFDYVCIGCTDGFRTVAEELDLPIGFGLLTCDTLEQAVARAGGDVGNKGEEAALAALEMANLRRSLAEDAS